MPVVNIGHDAIGRDIADAIVRVKGYVLMTGKVSMVGKHFRCTIHCVLLRAVKVDL